MRAWLGNYVYNNVASNVGDYRELQQGAPYNLHASVLETGFTTQQLLSDYYVERASFLRLDNLTVAYQFPYLGDRQIVQAQKRRPLHVVIREELLRREPRLEDRRMQVVRRPLLELPIVAHVRGHVVVHVVPEPGPHSEAQLEATVGKG